MLTSNQYFAVYGEHLSETGSTYHAWLLTERQFNRTYSDGNEVLYRYSTYSSFRKALYLYKKGVKKNYIKIHTREISL